MVSRKQGGNPAGAAARQRPAEPAPPGSANRGFGSVDPERQGYKPGAKPPPEEGSADASTAGAARKPGKLDKSARKDGAQQGGGAAAAGTPGGDKARSSRRR